MMESEVTQEYVTPVNNNAMQSRYLQH